MPTKFAQAHLKARRAMLAAQLLSKVFWPCGLFLQRAAEVGYASQVLSLPSCNLCFIKTGAFKPESSESCGGLFHREGVPYGMVIHSKLLGLHVLYETIAHHGSGEGFLVRSTSSASQMTSVCCKPDALNLAVCNCAECTALKVHLPGALCSPLMLT